jgi:hypothetical protein
MGGQRVVAAIDATSGRQLWMWPGVDEGNRVRRIGVLMAGVESGRGVRAFLQAFAGLGWTDGRNARMDFRVAGGDLNRMPALAQELVGLQPDIILVNGNMATAALQQNALKQQNPHKMRIC